MGEGCYKLVMSIILDWALGHKCSLDYSAYFCYIKYLIINFKLLCLLPWWLIGFIILNTCWFSSKPPFSQWFSPSLSNLFQHPPPSPCSLKLDWHATFQTWHLFLLITLAAWCSSTVVSLSPGKLCSLKILQCLLSATSSLTPWNHWSLELEQLEIISSKLLII